MNRQSIVRFICRMPLILGASLFAGNVAAELSEISVSPKYKGPVDILDLYVLLEKDMQFQIFEFEAEEDFCLVVGYIYEIDGQPTKRRPYNEVSCNQAGPHRLIFTSRWVGDKRRLFFGLYNLATGSGGGRSINDLSIGKEISGVATFRAEMNIRPGQESTLFRWRYGNNPPHPGPRHDISILVRLDENDGSIANFSKPNDFGR